jgi:hypothetical protein
VGTVNSMVAVARELHNGAAGMASPPDAPGTPREIGIAFASIVMTRGWSGLAGLLHPEVDFRGLTPSRAWLAVGPEQVCEVLREWETVEGTPSVLTHLSFDHIAHRHRVTYRLTFDGADSATQRVCEHTAYFDLDQDARIKFLRMMSSGVDAG